MYLLFLALYFLSFYGLVAAHGEERYNRYNDGEGTYHGGVRPSTELKHEDLDKLANSVPFYHRWEYDAESVFWTLYSVLLRVTPQGAQFSTAAQRKLSKMWEKLSRHTIEDDDDDSCPLLQDIDEDHVPEDFKDIYPGLPRVRYVLTVYVHEGIAWSNDYIETSSGILIALATIQWPGWI